MIKDLSKIFLLSLHIYGIIGISKQKLKLPSEESIQRAKSILDKTPVIDGHNDFPMVLRMLLQNDLTGFNFNSNLSAIDMFANSGLDHTDLPRMREGRLQGQFWSAYIGCSGQYKDSVQQTLEQIDVIKRLVQQNSYDMEFVTTSQGIRDAFVSGKIASLIGLESGHGIGSNLGILRLFYELGVRYMTLTHSCNTPWADSSSVESEWADVDVRSHGISEFGNKIVYEMNRLGMLVDLSHVSAETMQDALDISRAPLIFSHSSSRAVCSAARNVPDEILKQMPKNGGIVMVNFYSYYVNCGDPISCPSWNDCHADVYDIVEHINHIRDVVGIDHVGIGSDFCGVELLPEGMEDVSKYPILFAALLDDGSWSEEDLGKLASNNLIRVFSEVEHVRDILVDEQPYQEWIPSGDLAPEEKACSS